MSRYKYHIGVVLFFILVACLYYIRERSIRRDTSISLRPERVMGITISSGQESVFLSKTATGWELEPGLPARAVAVDMLFQTLERIRYTSPAPLSERERIRGELFHRSVRVDLKEGRRTNSFHICTDEIRGLSYIMLGPATSLSRLK
jgi:hypothetical protein